MAHRVSGGCRFCDGRAAWALATIRPTSLGRRPGSVEHSEWKSSTSLKSPSRRPDHEFNDLLSTFDRRVMHPTDQAPKGSRERGFLGIRRLEQQGPHRGRGGGLQRSFSWVSWLLPTPFI